MGAFLARGAVAKGSVEAGLRAVQPALAEGGERLAALPQSERFLEGGAPSLELADQLGQLVASGLIGRAGRIGHVATLRRATIDDAAALTRLRGLMHEAMGAAPNEDWRSVCEADFGRRIATDCFVAFVVEADDEVISGGAGWLEEHLPSPYQLDARRGHIASMSTDPAHRRRGYGKQVFEALMEWFAVRDIPRVDLRATPDGQPLYASFGFQVLGGATMAWTAPGNRPGMR